MITQDYLLVQHLSLLLYQKIMRTYLATWLLNMDLPVSVRTSYFSANISQLWLWRINHSVGESWFGLHGNILFCFMWGVTASCTNVKALVVWFNTLYGGPSIRPLSFVLFSFYWRPRSKWLVVIIYNVHFSILFLNLNKLTMLFCFVLLSILQSKRAY